MKLAILLWIYKDIALARNRAWWLRRHNPGVPIYCLYGGPADRAGRFAGPLAPLVDDFFAFTEPWDERQKWLHGDRMLAIWHRERGRSLGWDSVFLAQWDFVALAPARSLCGSLAAGELLLPGLRPVAEVESFWYWVRPGSRWRPDYLEFSSWMMRTGPFPADPLCCNLLAGALPRSFLDRYAAEAPEHGFLEYKLPMLAQRWGYRFCRDHALDPVWMQERPLSATERRGLVLHAEKEPQIPRLAIARHALDPHGARAFHPCRRPVPRLLDRLLR